MAPSPDCMVDVSTPQISEHIVYPLYAQPYVGNNTLFERSPRCFDTIAGFNSFTRMSLYRALVTVWPFSWKCINIGSLTSQKMVSMTFTAEACVLNFLLAGDDGCLHCIDCLSLVHYGTPRTRPLSQFDGERHLLHEHDSPNDPEKSSAVHHRTSVLGPHLLHPFLYPRSSWTILHAEL